MKRAVFYARVSTSAQEEKGTIESQIYELKKQIKEHGNIIVKEYIDNGYSGAKLDRPAMDKLRNDLKKETFDIIYFLDADRIARNSTYQDIIISEILRYKKEIVIKGRNLLYDAEGKFKMTVLGAVSELERAKIIERSTRGRRERARQGQIFSGISVYGYRYIKKTNEKPGHLVIDEKEAEVVKMLYNTYINEEIGLVRLMEILESRKIKTKTGNYHWSKSTINNILTNSTYYGVRFYNQSTRLETYSSQVKRDIMKYTRRDKNEWIPVKVPAIIDKELFDRVQRKLKIWKKEVRRENRKYLLKGLILCGVCGCKYVGNTATKGNVIYCCVGKKKNYPHRRKYAHIPEFIIKRCDNKGISDKRIEGVIWDTINEKILKPNVISEYIEELKDSVSDRRKKIEEELKLREKKIKEIECKKEKLLDLYLDGSFSKDQLDSKVEILEDEEREYQSRKVELHNSMEMINERSFVKRDINEFCELAKSRLKKLDFFEKRKFLNFLFESIVINGRELTLNGYLTKPLENEEFNVSYCPSGGRYLDAQLDVRQQINPVN